MKATERLPAGDYHTHTCFCDGADTPEDMVQAAIARGMRYFGLSGHMPVSCYENDWCMTEQQLPIYLQTVRRLQEQYGDRISILAGVEADTNGTGELDAFDYRIGSVHSICRDGIYIEVDGDPARVQSAVEMLFGGDGVAYACAYFAQTERIAQIRGCDFIGHFDVVTKFNEKYPFIDTEDTRYIQAATQAMDALIDTVPVMEINTGAISRGWLSHPYPSLPLLREWRRRGGQVIVNSDSHSTAHIGAHFDIGVQWARAAGYTQVLLLTEQGFTGWKI